MNNSTKQKDSFLSMFSRNKEESVDDGSGKRSVPVSNTSDSSSDAYGQGSVRHFDRNWSNSNDSQVPEAGPAAGGSSVSTYSEQSGEENGAEEGQLSIDVYQTEDDIVIKSSIAGIKPEDLDINIQNDMVTIRGNRQPQEKVDPEDYYYQECFWGPFSRAVILPVDVDPENVTAELEDGILTIRLPKAEKIKTRKIEVVAK